MFYLTHLCNVLTTCLELCVSPTFITSSALSVRLLPFVKVSDRYLNYN